MTTFPIWIDNGHGELLTFEWLVQTPEGDHLEATIIAQPQPAPPDAHPLATGRGLPLRDAAGHRRTASVQP